MSISKSQALALADNFLDDLGTDKSDLQPRNLATEAVLIAASVIEHAQENLIRGQHVASGKLSESLEASEPETNGSKMSMSVLMAPHGEFINSGVKGKKGGTSTRGYAFKYDLPSKSFVEAIQASIGRSSKKITNTRIPKSISRNELKNASVAQASRAYAVARSIIQKGIKPTGFMDRAMQAATRDVEQRFGKALQADIIVSLNRNLSNGR
jgi:hypothetical protein